MSVLFLCIFLVMLMVVVFYFVRMNKKSMDISKFADLLYKDDKEK
ncbi:Uncharacterised protein [Cronobacter universalis NCTC 9529]|uniref:Uncharacterized protein n=1 Tax=Cronobacter universalis NCTC 9529 TaxID=1074000 RepID=A0ABY1W106_9ENTR|nr:Uncharacterised protein [Cronobacter universalis NCTC 9529]